MRNEVNPYIAGSPVRTPSMFFGREQVFETIKRCLVESDPARVVVLHGQRRMGKTSVLYQISYHLPAHYVPLLIDLQAMSLEGLASLLWEVSQMTRRGLRRSLELSIPMGDRVAWFEDPQEGIRAFFAQVQRLVGDRRIVLMFDETMLIADKIVAGTLEDGVFSCFADLMSRYAFLDFVFSIGSKAVLMEEGLTTLSRPTTYQEISFLEPAAARALIVEPVRGILAYEPRAVEQILRLTSGQPYYTQLVCHELFNHALAKGRRTIGVTDVEQVRPRIVEMATSQLHYVWGETSELGQRVLSALAEMEKQGEQVGSARQIGRFLLRRGVMAGDKDIMGCIDNLQSRCIIAKDIFYSFSIDLFRYWILQNQRLDRL